MGVTYSGMERDLRMGFLGLIVSIGVARSYSLGGMGVVEMT